MIDSIVTSLTQRGFIDSVTHPELAEMIQKKGKVTVYCGFDPTAESLHLGNFLAIMGLAWFRRAGHNVVALIGGATGMIGDPSGKKQERSLLGEDALQKNVQKITDQLQNILTRIPGEGSISIVNNRDWYRDVNCIDFLRDIGKHFRVGQMLAKESVRARIQSEEGISFTEFTYQILQAHDFFHLFSKKDVLIQMGGSDQWGNITAGTDYIRKLTGKEAYGITFSLLVKSDGQKFGKSEKGAIWLSNELLSEYEFYQQLYRVSDQDVFNLLRKITFVEDEVIRSLEEQHQKGELQPNQAQKLLAAEVTTLVHGAEGLEKALSATSRLMPGHSLSFTKESVELMAKEIQPVKINKSSLLGQKVVDILPLTGLIESKSEARRLIKNGGISLNGQRVSSEADVIGECNLIGDTYIVIGLGKKQRALIEAE